MAMNTLLKEFREFAIQGNATDMAVGLIVGVGFKDLISSFVNDIVMPPLGLLLGGMDYTDLFVVLKGEDTYATLAEAQKASAITMNYGLFLGNLIEFTLIAFVVFLVIRWMNSLRTAKKQK